MSNKTKSSCCSSEVLILVFLLAWLAKFFFLLWPCCGVTFSAGETLFPLLGRGYFLRSIPRTNLSTQALYLSYSTFTNSQLVAHECHAKTKRIQKMKFQRDCVSKRFSTTHSPKFWNPNFETTYYQVSCSEYYACTFLVISCLKELRGLHLVIHNRTRLLIRPESFAISKIKRMAWRQSPISGNLFFATMRIEQDN